MTAPGRIYISCATADVKDWRSRVLTAWVPLETDGTFDLWYREREDDFGQLIEYHAAVLLITENYFADKEVQKREFVRFIEFASLGRGLFWIPIHETLYNRTELGLRSIVPAWGFRSAGAEVSTVASLSERQFSSVWINVAHKIIDWWAKSSSKLDGKLEDTRVNKQIVTAPIPQSPSRVQFAANDWAQQLRILPCLIDRERQERTLSKRATSARADYNDKVVFVLPGPREERPDRFADRFDGYTIAALKAKGALQNNIEFCRAGWPTQAGNEAVRSLFEEYLDAVFNSMRVELDCDSSKNDADYMNDAAALLKPRMRDTRFVFWTEIPVIKPGQVAQELVATVFAWWRRFIPAQSASNDFLVPIVVLAPATTKTGLVTYLSDVPPPGHVEILAELLPIELLDMVRWLTLSEVRALGSAGILREKIDELYPKGDERIPFAALEKDVVKWLMAAH